MFHVLDRPHGRCRTDSPNREVEAVRTAHAAQSRFILEMQQNRSAFPQEGRLLLSVIASLLFATSILPVLHGYWLVPIFSLGTMALLVLALEAHAKARPFEERLELADGEVRYADSNGRMFALPSYWVRLEAEAPTPADMRLLLRNRDHRFEVGLSLSLEEKQAVAPLIASALAGARGR